MAIKINYYARDLDTIMDGLSRFVQSEEPDLWTDFLESNLGVILLRSVAYVGDVNSFAIDRAVNEIFPSTAKRRASVLRFGRAIGFTGRGVSSASVVVHTPNNELPAEIESYSLTVPKNTRVSLGGVDFETTSDWVFPPTVRTGLSDTYLEFDLVQGASYEEDFTSNGASWQEFQSSESPVVDGSWGVTVNGVSWSEVDDLLSAQLENVYQVSYEEDDTILIQFGNGVYGNVPEANATITVSYRTADGEVGNIEVGSIDTYINAQYTGGTVRLRITNDERASGGRDADTLDYLRRNIPLYLKSQRRAVTADDYESLANQFTSPTYGSPAHAKASLRYSSYGFNVASIVLSSSVIAGTSVDSEIIGTGDGSEVAFESNLLFSSYSALAIKSPATLPTAFESEYYEFYLTGEGGLAPYDWDIVSGSLPSGLELYSAEGVIKGTPAVGSSVASPYSFTIELRDNDYPQSSVSLVMSLAVSTSPAFQIITTAIPDGEVGDTFSELISVHGGTGPYSWSVSGGSLPLGLSLNTNTGKISGVPSSTGTYNFDITATDSVPNSDSVSFTVTINSRSDIIFPGSVRVIPSSGTPVANQWATARDFPRSNTPTYGDIRANDRHYSEQVGTGDGTVTPSISDLSIYPIEPGSLSITTLDDQTPQQPLDLYDDGTGNLQDSSGNNCGVIDYSDGTWTTAIDYTPTGQNPANGQPISARYLLDQSAVIGWVNYQTGEIDVEFTEAPASGANLYTYFNRFARTISGVPNPLAAGSVVFVRDYLDDVGNAGIYRWNGELWEALMFASERNMMFPVNVVDIFVWSTDASGNYTSTGSGLKTALRDYLHTAGVVTVGVNVEDGEVIPVAFDLGAVTVSRDYDADTVREEIGTALSDIFTSIHPGDDLLVARVHEAIQEVDGVVNYSLEKPFIDVIATNEQILSYGRVYDRDTGERVADESGTLVIDTVLDWATIKAETFTLYIKRSGTEIVSFDDDGAGGLVDPSGTEIDTASLDYRTGTLYVTFLGTASVVQQDEVYVDYEYEYRASFSYEDKDLTEELEGDCEV